MQLIVLNSGVCSPWIDWSALHRKLRVINFDLLIILDMCSAGAAVCLDIPWGKPTGPLPGQKRLELLAASGFDSVAAGPGITSFTWALIQELRANIYNSPFYFSSLHRSIHKRMLRAYIRFNGPGPDYDQRLPTNPVYLTLREFDRSITFGRPSSA